VTDWTISAGFAIAVTLAGWWWVPALAPVRPPRVAHAGLAYLAGAALITLAMLGLAFVSVPITRATVLACMAASAALGWLWTRRGPARPPADVAGSIRSSLPLLAVAGVVLALATVLALLGPVHITDYFRAWGLKGLVVAHHHDLVFSEVSRNWRFYPLELSNLYAALFLLLGHADETVIRLPLLMFGWSLAAAVWWFAQLLLPPAGAALAVVLAVATPQFVTATSNGLADVALAAYITVATLAACLWIRDDGAAWAAIGGFAAGAAAWTKLEGLPAAIVILVGVLVVRRRPPPGLVTWLAWFAAFVVPWQIYQRTHDIDVAAAHFRRRFLDFPWIAEHLSRTLLETTPWGVFWPLCIGVIAVTVPLWWRTDARWLAAVTLPNLVVTAGAYVIHHRTGDPTAIHYTAHRLYLHLAPAVGVMTAAAVTVAWPAAAAPLHVAVGRLRPRRRRQAAA
jgi:hypothetical protein